MKASQIERAVKWLDAIDGSDPEAAHFDADNVLLYFADAEVAAAYHRVAERCSWWAHA